MVVYITTIAIITTNNTIITTILIITITIIIIFTTNIMGMAHLSLYSEPRLNLVTIVFNSLSRALLSPTEPTSYTQGKSKGFSCHWSILSS